MAVSKQNFLSSKRKEVRSTPSRLLLSIFSPPGVDLSLSVSACLTSPPRHIKRLLAPPFMFLNLPTYSSSSGLLPVDRLVGWAHSSAAYPSFSLHYLLPTDSWGWGHRSYKGVWRRNPRLVSPACVLVGGGGVCANASLARTGVKRPSWSPGEGEVKTSRKNSCRELCSTHLYTQEPLRQEAGVGIMEGCEWGL